MTKKLVILSGAKIASHTEGKDLHLGFALAVHPRVRRAESDRGTDFDPELPNPEILRAIKKKKRTQDDKKACHPERSDPRSCPEGENLVFVFCPEDTFVIP
jgi:hypothetical protein